MAFTHDTHTPPSHTHTREKAELPGFVCVRGCGSLTSANHLCCRHLCSFLSVISHSYCHLGLSAALSHKPVENDKCFNCSVKMETVCVCVFKGT